MNLTTIKNLEKILQTPVYLVGGAVRDFLMDKEPKDWDFTTALTPDLVKARLQNASKSCHTQGEKFGTIGTKIESGLFRQKNLKDPIFVDVEITTMRGEEYDQLTKKELLISRKPSVNYITDLKEDLSRRDFTINSMAMDSSGKIIDYFGGIEDIKNGIIRTVGDSKLRFKEDPLRILRGIRFAGKFDYELEQKTWDRICKMKFELLRVSKERWVIELDKILGFKDPSAGLNLLMDSGVLGVIIPELSLQKNYNQNSRFHDFDLWTHTVKVVKNIPSDNLNLRWTALLHDIAKPFTRTENKNGQSNYIDHDLLGGEMVSKTCNYLKFSSDKKNYIVEQVKNHLKIDSELKKYDDISKKIYSKD
jgi:tRNA nucleotidyltransferase (CCA-adding enzyme)